MYPWQIRKWRADDVDEVFGLCSKQAQTCSEFSQPLESPEVFDSWQGWAATAAQQAGNKHRVDIDAHGVEVAQVGRVARQAGDEAVVAGSVVQDRGEYHRRGHDA